MIIILMGVSGSGKSTIGKSVSSKLGWQFCEGDDFHPQNNIEKMKAGIALTDGDRAFWLKNLREEIKKLRKEKKSAVISCSALKRSYRDMLAGDNEDVKFVYLKGEYSLILKRLKNRLGHFFSKDLLKSQYETLEEPEDALIVDVRNNPHAIAGKIFEKFYL